MKNLIVDGISVCYRDTGTGPVLLFLHGWGTGLVSFDRLVQELGELGRRIIAPDLPGFGKSELPPSAWGVGDYTLWVRHFLDKLGIAQPEVVVGHSFGGRIAIKSVAKEILKPSQLVLIASAGMATPSMSQRFLSLLVKVTRPIAGVPPFSFIKKSLQRKFRSRDYLKAGALKGTFVKVVGENLRTDAEKIKIPTLLIWGEKDAETPLAEACALQGAVQNSKLEIIPEAGHFVHEEVPQKVAQIIKTFTIHA